MRTITKATKSGALAIDASKTYNQRTMTELDKAILNNRNILNFSHLCETIQNTEHLTDSDKEEFKKIREVASDFNNWNFSDLAIGCKVTEQRLKHTFNLSDESIAAIVRLASYDWR